MADPDNVPMNSRYMDYAEHEQTYRMFTTLTKRVSIALAVLLILMAYFLV